MVVRVESSPGREADCADAKWCANAASNADVQSVAKKAAKGRFMAEGYRAWP
jgi:hypothetical protein